MTRSISSSCSLNSHPEEEVPPVAVHEHDDLFGTESDEEPAASRAESAKGEEPDVEADRVKILPSHLEPPPVGFNEDGAVLPSEFELADALELVFPYERVQHPTEHVVLFAPGELLDVELDPFDETASNGYAENGIYQKRVIRWNENAEGEMECNSRVVEWDDGSMSLYVEGKWYDLGRESFTQGTELLCINQGSCYQALHAVETGLVTVAAPDESEEESEMDTATESSEQRKPKTKRVTVLVNPVKEREMKLKRIEEERRDRELMERKQRNLQERYTLPSQLDDLEEEEEMGHVPSSMKRSRPTRHQPARAKKHRPMEQLDEEETIIEDEEEIEEDLESDVQASSEEEAEGAFSEVVPSPDEAPKEQVSEEEPAPNRRTVVMTDEEEDEPSDG